MFQLKSRLAWFVLLSFVVSSLVLAGPIQHKRDEEPDSVLLFDRSGKASSGKATNKASTLKSNPAPLVSTPKSQSEQQPSKELKGSTTNSVSPIDPKNAATRSSCKKLHKRWYSRFWARAINDAGFDDNCPLWTDQKVEPIKEPHQKDQHAGVNADVRWHYSKDFQYHDQVSGPPLFDENGKIRPEAVTAMGQQQTVAQNKFYSSSEGPKSADGLQKNPNNFGMGIVRNAFGPDKHGVHMTTNEALQKGEPARVPTLAQLGYGDKKDGTPKDRNVAPKIGGSHSEEIIGTNRKANGHPKMQTNDGRPVYIANFEADGKEMDPTKVPTKPACAPNCASMVADGGGVDIFDPKGKVKRELIRRALIRMKRDELVERQMAYSMYMPRSLVTNIGAVKITA